MWSGSARVRIVVEPSSMLGNQNPHPIGSMRLGRSSTFTRRALPSRSWRSERTNAASTPSFSKRRV